METPDQPSVPMSEPEAEQRMMDEFTREAENGEFDGIKIHLPFAKEYLAEKGLDVDDEGFIIRSDTGEYAVPYVFVDDLVKEFTKDQDESVFDAFFRPVTHEKVYGWDNERIHLSDLHGVITTDDGKSHPVRDGHFDIAEFHARLETAFRVVMGWSDIMKEENLDEHGRWLGYAKESEEDLTLTCMNSDCNYSGTLDSWDGDEYVEPVCPDCGGVWDSDDITVCTICESWYWGTHFEGDTMYAEPACPNCKADMEYLERVYRYDSTKDYEEIVAEEKPSYTVVGLGENENVVYNFDYLDTWEEAVDEKEFAESMVDGTAFEDVEKVAIYELDPVEEVTYYQRDDDQQT